MTEPGSIHQFELSGGELCLDFANTIEDRPRAEQEHLHGWQDLVAWAEQAGVVTAPESAALRRKTRAHPRAAGRALTRARELRELVYRVFHAVAAGTSPADADVSSLNAELGRVLPHARVIRKDDGYEWSWSGEQVSLERVLWPVVRSAAELLVSPDHADVRECASETCSWLFIDRSRRRSRRWCSMKTCGNRDKVRRFYERQRHDARR